MSWDALAQIVIFGGAFAVAAVMRHLKRKRGEVAVSLKDSIRNRTKKMLERTQQH